MTEWHPDLPESYRNQIVTGDARMLAEAIPDQSVDLVFTDPVYSERHLYDWLGQVAQRILRPGGAVLVWSNGHWHRKNADWLEAAGLTYRWDFAYVITSGASPMNGHIIAKTNRLLWFDLAGASQMVGYLADGYAGVTWSRPDTHNHRWTKSPRYTIQALRAFCRPGAVVLDPFTGGGTVPACCRAIGLDWIAFELDPSTADLARERVRCTQAPLPGLVMPEQLALEVAGC